MYYRIDILFHVVFDTEAFEVCDTLSYFASDLQTLMSEFYTYNKQVQCTDELGQILAKFGNGKWIVKTELYILLKLDA